MNWHVLKGDALQLLREVPDNSCDALVCDPPAGIEFGGRDWDTFKQGKRSRSWAACNKTGGEGFGGFGRALRPAFHTQGKEERDAFVAFMTEVMAQAHRALKPGAHALVWAIPRTSHWTAWALEEAGFEVRDVIDHVFGQGMPKSKKLEDGIGTALKPAKEHWILARKPVKGSITANYKAIGTGGLNIDGCRVERAEGDVPGWHQSGANGSEGYQGEDTFRIRAMSAAEIQERCGDKGRWPTNLVLSHLPECDEACGEGCPVAEMDGQSGHSKSRPGTRRPNANRLNPSGWKETNRTPGVVTRCDEGGASRFFPTFHYFAKPSRAEREAGLEELPLSTLNRVNPGGLEKEPRFAPVEVKNNHPTVKGLSLMSWLCRLITPPGGIVLDPFCGSGTTGVACVLEGFRFLGIEQDPHYVAIARERIKYWEKQG